MMTCVYSISGGRSTRAQAVARRRECAERVLDLVREAADDRDWLLLFQHYMRAILSC
jgi:hypothetical protein